MFNIRRTSNHSVEVTKGRRTLLMTHRYSCPEIVDVYAFVRNNNRISTRTVDAFHKPSAFTRAAMAAVVAYLAN